MKLFTLLISLFLLNLGVSYGSGPATDCGCKDSDNSLKNGGFESGTANWQKSDGTKFGTDTEYSQCGSNNGLMDGAGTVYQDVDLTAGSKVTLTVYGGTHDVSFTHTFKLRFYNSSGNIVPITQDAFNTVDMDYKVVQKHKLKQFQLSATAPAGATKVRFSLVSSGNYFKVDVACMSIEKPSNPVSCCSDADNAIKNGSFEDGINHWEKGSTNFYAEDKYEMCGNNNGLINGSGSVYQDVNLTGGSQVSVTAYGGTHNTGKVHLFKLEFYNGTMLLNDGKAQTTMDYGVTDSKLKQFSVSSTAPANATKVRFILYSEGDYFKVDVVCMTVTPPPTTPCTACAESETVIKNASFEKGTADWSKMNNTNFSTVAKSYACGGNVGKIDGSGIVFQEVSAAVGATITVSAYGATDNPNGTQQFLLVFYNSAGQVISGGTSVEVNKNVSGGLQQYSLAPTVVPANTAKVYFGMYSTGDKFYFDAICMSITPPTQCETCDNNRLTNAGFESGTSGWNSEGNFTLTSDAKNCGDKGAKLIGAGKFWQDINFQSSWGSQITLNFWSAKISGDGQKFEIIFKDASNKVLGTLTKAVTKVWTNAPVGMEKYMLAGNIPEGTQVITVQGSETSGEMRADGLCLTITGSPLPVTLASFDVTKEGSAAQLRWATTYESNSGYFDVQHSQDGKNWTKLATVGAQGESKSLITYSYTHTSPFSVNLYRLKMVDLDETFAYSSIKSLNFSGEEDMKIYPNPTSDRIRLTSKQQVENVKIYNQQGILLMDTLPDSSNEVSLTHLVQGTYFVKINNGASVRKIIVIR